MSLKKSSPDVLNPDVRHRPAWPVVVTALTLFGLLAMLPSILPALHLNLHPAAPNSSYGVTLMVAPRTPHSVHVGNVAKPLDPTLAPATLTTANADREAAAVAAEDKRLRVVLHDSSRVYQPEVIPVRGSLPTLVLTAGNSASTAATLVQYGAMVMLPNNAALLLDNVYVSTNATLDIGGSTLRTLYLDSGSGGFASIVGWNGNLVFKGTAAHPLTIMGWDRSTSTPAADLGYGRSYIREAGGSMTLTNVRATDLGFWSGRTGGVSWTGLSGKPSTGGATDSTFTGDTYGSFISRGIGVTFKDDLFEYNQLDGLHVHRYSQNITATASSSVRNGGSGFVVSPATSNTLLYSDIAQNNSGDGYFINGRPLATGASASGGSITPGSGNSVEYSAALNNGKIGVLVEGGTGTVVKGDQVCAAGTAVSVRSGATDSVVTGNTIRCNPRSGFSVGPLASGTELAGNAVDGARTAFLIRTAGHVELDKNLVTNGRVFGVSSRGASTVTGTDNTLAGTGFRAIDARAGAPMPALYDSNTANWAYHSHTTFINYLQFHPLAAMWVTILLIVILAFIWSQFRRPSIHPYPNSTNWTGAEAEAITAPAAAEEVNIRYAQPQHYVQQPPLEHLPFEQRETVAAGYQRDPVPTESWVWDNAVKAPRPVRSSWSVPEPEPWQGESWQGEPSELESIEGPAPAPPTPRYDGPRPPWATAPLPELKTAKAADDDLYGIYSTRSRGTDQT